MPRCREIVADGDQLRPLGLNGISVLASEHGTGVGQGLLNVPIDDRGTYLRIAADNPRAAAFYRRNGFTADAATAEHPPAGTMVAIECMVR